MHQQARHLHARTDFPGSGGWSPGLARRLGRVDGGFRISVLLAATNLALLLFAGLLGWVLWARNVDLVYAFERRQAAALVDAISDEALWDRHVQLVGELATFYFSAPLASRELAAQPHAEHT